MHIDQHETELKELLTRVMREPLQPLQAQIDQAGEQMAHIDAQVKNLRDRDLADLSVRFDDVEKVLKRLRIWTEESAATDVKNAVLPPVQDALNALSLGIKEQTEALSQPVQSMCQEVALTATAVDRLAEQSAQGRTLAVQRDAGFEEKVRSIASSQSEQWRLTQIHVREAFGKAVERLSTEAGATRKAQEELLHQLVNTEVSKRMDKLIIQGRWAIGVALVAVCAAVATLGLLLSPLH